MIDCDKLQTVAKLAEELKQHKVVVILRFGKLSSSNTDVDYYIEQNLEEVGEDGDFFQFKDIDTLITKIGEIIMSKTKYQIGQSVWRLNERLEPECFVIKGYRDGLYLDGKEHPLFLSGWEEHHIYPSLRALVQAQIAYWNNFLPDNDDIHVGVTINSNGQARSLSRQTVLR